MARDQEVPLLTKMTIDLLENMLPLFVRYFNIISSDRKLSFYLSWLRHSFPHQTKASGHGALYALPISYAILAIV
jgi:hypothetical protein